MWSAADDVIVCICVSQFDGKCVCVVRPSQGYVCSQLNSRLSCVVKLRTLYTYPKACFVNYYIM